MPKQSFVYRSMYRAWRSCMRHPNRKGCDSRPCAILLDWKEPEMLAEAGQHLRHCCQDEGSNGAELTGSIGSIRLNGETCAGQIISSSCNMSCCRCGKRLNFSSNFPDSTSNSALESLIRRCSLIWVFVRTMSSPRSSISMTCSAILAADLLFQTPSTESS